MKARTLFVRFAACLIVVCASCAVMGTSRIPRGPLPAFQKGIAYTGYHNDSYDGEGARTAMKELAATGARWVQVLVTGYQDTIKSTIISRTGEETPTDTSLISIIRYAQRLGLMVLLKPHVDLLREPSRWRGQIGLGFSEAEWSLWFASYRSFIVHYAALAKSLGVEMFSVGCELDATVRRKDEWEGTIALVRAAYQGPLIYADDQVEFAPEAVQWWDKLDLIGMDAYPTLTTVVHPTVADFAAGWSAWLDKLRALSKKWRKPAVLTEIGYRSIEGGAQNPWDWQRNGPVDLEVQANAYEAALRAVQGEAFLRGMYWWQWSPDPAEGGSDDKGYSPHGKPAEKILKSWFRRAFLR
jgi:hypothetical protein